MLKLTDIEKAKMKLLARKATHALHRDSRITILDWDKFKIDWYLEDDKYGRYAYIFLMFQPIISEDLCTYEASPEVKYLMSVLHDLDMSFGMTASIGPRAVNHQDFDGDYEGNQALVIIIRL